MNKTTLIPITAKGGFLSTKRKLSQVVPNQAKKSSFLLTITEDTRHYTTLQESFIKMLPLACFEVLCGNKRYLLFVYASAFNCR